MRYRLLAVFAVVAVAAGLGLVAQGSAHVQETEAVALSRGCNNITVTWPNGTPMVVVAAAVTPAGALTSGWRFDNRAQRFVGFAPGSPQTSDLGPLNRLDSLFLCTSAPATLVRPALAVAGTGGTPAASPPASHGGRVQDYVSLVDTLRAAGATVVPTGELPQSFLSVPRLTLSVNGEEVSVFEYPDEAAAAAEAVTISADGSSFRRGAGAIVQIVHVDWVAPPHFYRQGRVIALYLGSNPDVVQLLTSVLGPQFAGR